MANAADNYQWDENNVFNSWDLNPLAQQVGGGADGVRDSLSASRDAYLKPYYQNYRSAVGAGNSAEDDQGLFNSGDFQNYVKTGQTSKGYAADPSGPQSVTQAWNSQPAAPVAAPPSPNADLYSALKNQVLQNGAIAQPNVDVNNPVIRNQVDAYRAEQQRGARNSIADVAEGSSPNANLRGETRLANEHAAQNTAGFQATLVGQEYQRQRDQIMQEIQLAQNQGQFDQAQQMQAVLANLDSQFKSRGLDLQSNAQDMAWKQALMQNQQFMDSLGLQAEDRSSYWDAVRSGLLG